jgi:hypothetical protein
LPAPSDSQFQEIHPEASSRAFDEPTKFYLSRLGCAEWTNIIFTVTAILGGLFVAFYFFNGAELSRVVGSWPGEYLYPRSFSPNDFERKNRSPVESAFPSPTGAVANPSGDPFSRAGGPLSLESPSLARLARGVPPPSASSPGAPVLPGLPGVLPPSGIGPGTLISQLGLLPPGKDALSQTVKDGVATQRESRKDAERTVVVEKRKVVRREKRAAKNMGRAANRVTNTNTNTARATTKRQARSAAALTGSSKVASATSATEGAVSSVRNTSSEVTRSTARSERNGGALGRIGGHGGGPAVGDGCALGGRGGAGHGGGGRGR